ncbi:sigma-E factor negative regulatory protein [Niveibacterium sp. SC-1]|uniref:sigma-E factor negative regulatory protein n=1 Tax=Niveibacterium sp. SC-1 TaxID=3135646 RepID=UPI00312045AE
MDDRISALLDGELDDAGTAAALDVLRAEPEARRQWQMACLIGDTLREGRVGTPDMVDAVMTRLEREPTVLAPVAEREAVIARAPANDTSWRRVMSIAAAVMGIVVVAWSASRFQEPMSPVAAFAKAGVAPAVARVASATEGDATRAYLLAHQAYAGGAASPGVASYVRTASVQTSDTPQ